MHYTVFDVTKCTINKQLLFIIYVPPTCFDLYKVIVKEIFAKAYRYVQQWLEMRKGKGKVFPLQARCGPEGG